MAFVNKAVGNGSDIEWDKMNQHIIDVVGTQNKAKSVVGIISGIYDLGIQAQEDAKMEWNGTPEQEAAAIEDKPATYFKDEMDYQTKTMKRYKKWPQKSVQSVALSVDFPQYMVDKAQFFTGESNPAPLRLLLNGEFTPKGGKEKGLGRVYGLSWTKLASDEWSLKQNSMPYKLGVITDVINDSFPFTPEDIPKLLGKAAQFEIKVSVHDGFLREKIKLQGVIPEGLPVPELDPKYLHTFEFDVENSPETIKQMRVSVLNTVKKATNYQGNTVQQQIEGASGASNAGTAANTAQSEDTPQGAAQKAPVDAPMASQDFEEGFNEDNPF